MLDVIPASPPPSPPPFYSPNPYPGSFGFDEYGVVFNQIGNPLNCLRMDDISNWCDEVVSDWWVLGNPIDTSNTSAWLDAFSGITFHYFCPDDCQSQESGSGESGSGEFLQWVFLHTDIPYPLRGRLFQCPILDNPEYLNNFFIGRKHHSP